MILDSPSGPWMQSYASLRGKQREILMHTSREGDMKVEAETGVMWTQAKEHLQPPEAERGKEWILA